MPHSIYGTLVSKTDVQAATNGSVDMAAAKSFIGFAEIITFVVRATANGATSLQLELESSFDEGVTWFSTGFVFSLITGDGDTFLHSRATKCIGPLVRVKRTATGDGYDYTIQFAGNPVGRS